MTSLTETAYYTRRAINWMTLAVIVYFILRFFWGLFLPVLISLFPPKQPLPNHAFGKLPALQFPQPIASPSAEYSFRLETIEGSIPKASESAVVYFMPKSPANLLALTRTQEFAKRLDFDPNPIQETKNIYRFNDAQFPLRRLRYDIISNNFIVRYAFEQDTGIFLERKLPSSDEAIAELKGLLQTYNLYIDDFRKGTSTISYFRLSADHLIPTTSLSTADSVRVDLFRRSIGGLSVVTPYPNEGPISIMFSGSMNQKKRIVQFAYTYWPIDYDTMATYALKTSNQAWQELQDRKAYIAQYPSKGNTIVVRTVRVAYYDSFDPQTYLQPIFVFEGDEGFMAYVPAVAPPWTD